MLYYLNSGRFSALSGYFSIYSVTSVAEWCSKMICYKKKKSSIDFLTQAYASFPSWSSSPILHPCLKLSMMFKVWIWRLTGYKVTKQWARNPSLIFSLQMDWLTPEMWTVLCEPRCFPTSLVVGRGCCAPLPWQQNFSLSSWSWRAAVSQIL